VLIGIAGASNRRRELDIDPPVLLGDPVRARQVMQAGIDRPRLQMSSLEDLKAQFVIEDSTA
jgi:hypothetical protein